MNLFQCHTKTIFGIKSAENLDDLIKGYSTVAVLCDENVRSTQKAERVISKFISLTTVHDIKLRGSDEPDYTYLSEITESVRAIKPDLIVGIGGGSTLDISKAVAALITNTGSPIKYRGFDQLTTPAIDSILIPTTAGTGSEITYNAPFVDLELKQKMGINGRYVNPTYAVLDPEFIVSAPQSVQISAGIDALVHAIESYTCNKANNITKSYSTLACQKLITNLPTLIDDPENLDKLLDIQIGAYYAALAMTNSGSGIAAGISYPLGVHYKIPHGICGGMFILNEVKFNVENGYSGYEELFGSKDVINTLGILIKKLNIPTSLLEFGVTTTDYDTVLNLMTDMQGCFNQNPVPFDATKDIKKIITPSFV
jgi:alcohol dehydrogenase